MTNKTTFTILSTLFIIFFMTSCGAKKKVYRTVDSPTTISKERTGTVKGKTSITAYYASLLQADARILNEDLYSLIDDWIGSPHRLGGQTKEGIDCSAFVGFLYRDVYKKNLPRSSKDMAELIKRKYDDQLEEGDLVFFSFGGQTIDHVGVYLHNGKFVHVSTKQGVVISNLKDAWYYKYLTRCGTPKI